MIKRFLEWIHLKQVLHEREHQSPRVKERDVWGVSLGENVGSEMNGKSKKFSRPAVIYKKLSRHFYLVVPLTTKRKEGSWYVHFVLHAKDEYACLHQIRTVDYRRLYDQIGVVSKADFMKIENGFDLLYKNNVPRNKRGSWLGAECVYMIAIREKLSNKIFLAREGEITTSAECSTLILSSVGLSSICQLTN